jgi:FkbM family methyltransferase
MWNGRLPKDWKDRVVSIRGKVVSALVGDREKFAKSLFPKVFQENKTLKKRVAALEKNASKAQYVSKSGKDNSGALVYDPVLVLGDDDGKYKFHCDTEKEKRRASRLFTKETGTIEWIKRDCRQGDVFFDVGANIGLYTVFSGSKVGAEGTVYSFEPHAINFAALLKTIHANNFESIVHAISLPLGNELNFGMFNYQSLAAASSTSQFEGNSYEGDVFVPKYSELKYCVSVDYLLSLGLIKPAQMVKIDVDGLDYEVLKGMEGMLREKSRPRSIQIELGTSSMQPILDLLEDVGYKIVERHWTEAGHAHIAAGGVPEAYPHYGICWPKDRQE